MADRKPSYTAGQSAAGYFYQARLALAECLRFAYDDSDIEVAIEKLDDVSFESGGTPQELLQTKHHITKIGDLTDASVDLWKTIRIWAEQARDDPSLPGRTRLALVTTGRAPVGSAASYLRPAETSGEGRNAEEAERILLEVAARSKNAELKKAFEAFLGLTPAMRRSLLFAIEVLDNAPNIVDLGPVIESRLRMIAPRGKVSLAREQLEGWWWPRICATLQAAQPSAISILELEQKLDEIRESLKRDALPLDMEEVDPPQEELDALEEMRFVRQLRAIGVGSNRLQFAKRDYYRAFTQRSRWTRQSLLFDGEVSRFERMLVEEWQPRYERMCEGLADGTHDAELKQGGQALYGWVETEARFPFRTIANRFLNVGSYHILANDLRVGWHRDYAALLAKDGGGGDGDAG